MLTLPSDAAFVPDQCPDCVCVCVCVGGGGGGGDRTSVHYITEKYGACDLVLPMCNKITRANSHAYACSARKA